MRQRSKGRYWAVGEKVEAGFGDLVAITRSAHILVLAADNLEGDTAGSLRR